jgi:hypothetical protein
LLPLRFQVSDAVLCVTEHDPECPKRADADSAENYRRAENIADKKKALKKKALWPAPGSEDTELGVLMELEVGHGETEVYPRVQA